MRPRLGWALREAGRATSPLRVLPEFLVVGGQRCGTTSLHRALRQHPAVVDATLRKGVHFFDLKYGKGLAWYRGHFPLDVAVRVRSSRLGQRVIAGESSPYYMFHPLAPERFSRDLPAVKVIAMLRDPVERAYSAHAHETVRGFESLPFAQAIAAEEGRLKGEVERLRSDPGYVSQAHQHNAYVSRGRYVEQLTAMETYLGRDRIHVVDSHQFFADPHGVVADTLAFLGLDPDAPIDARRHNERPRAAMDPRLRADLEQMFADSDAALERWWGRRPGWLVGR
ncbi:sulfotransferase domain-containing protein [Angustibacter sp. McL0619]|uniref:sulfotransferase domain-containing protein n=1 Tax=Angustibacter sp. McL0619 TaxID=3415676 RepID=UPI003CF887D3